MGDLSPMLIAACGLAVVCAGLLFVTVLIVLRFLGGSRGGAILGLFGGAAKVDDSDLDYDPNRRSRRLSPSDLKAKAQAVDFDAALQKYKSSTPPTTASSQSAAPTSPPPAAPSLRGTPVAPLNPGVPPTPTPSVSQNTTPLDNTTYNDFDLRNNPNSSVRRKRREFEDDRDEFVGGLLDGE